MGMFDTVLVHESLLRGLFNKEANNKDVLDALQDQDGYCDFQTKDLENALFTYKLKEDAKLYLERASWFKDEEKISELKETLTHITSYVEFYTYFNTTKERIHLNLNMHIVEGKLQEMHIDTVKREDLEIVELRAKKARLFWELRETFWEMKAFRLLQRIEWRVNKLWYSHVSCRYHNLTRWLGNRADQKASKHEQNYNQFDL